MDAPGWLSDLNYRIFFPCCRLLVKLVFLFHGGWRVEGKANVPKTGGVLICPNHICDADPPAVGAALPRRPIFMAKSELFTMRIIGPLMRFFRAFPVKRDSADRAALRRAVQLLEAGEAVIIFPEGGGNFAGTLQPLHPGALLVALQARVPIVPTAVINTNQVLPYGAVRPQRSHEPVRIVFGEPIDLSDLYGKRGALEEATRRLTERLAQMLGQPIPEGKPTPHDERPSQRAGE